jgi:hypothetical protein
LQLGHKGRCIEQFGKVFLAMQRIAWAQTLNPAESVKDNRVILYLIMTTFGRELVVLLTKPSMFGKFLVQA